MGRNNADFHDATEHVMDYEENPNTGTWHEVIQKGDGMSAPAYTRLAPKTYPGISSNKGNK